MNLKNPLTRGVEIDKNYEIKDVVKEHDRDAWSKCPHCGAGNGLYGRKKEQHRPRCYYKGDSNSIGEGFMNNCVTVPNHNKYIEEDDSYFLFCLNEIKQNKILNNKASILENIISDILNMINICDLSSLSIKNLIKFDLLKIDEINVIDLKFDDLIYENEKFSKLEYMIKNDKNIFVKFNEKEKEFKIKDDEWPFISILSRKEKSEDADK